ncbi:large ribosomal subunit protein eL31-like [Ochotona princeps]|uniref:large ribosomal subunit protein eL31-like n=1 Tax=Ochotona princeps TaxID=9978 RepID=UPI0027153C45|nr:large ribosomal subunit protein eL31-like [Ochotona princeps]
MVLAKKDSEKGYSGINEVAIPEHTINIHKSIHRVDIKKLVRWALKQIWRFATKEMGTPDVCIDPRLNKAVWAKGIRNVLYHIHLRSTRKHKENEDSPHKLSTLVTYVLVTTFKIYTVDEN